ncbi:tetratricopeptide repeat protein [Photobacterium sp. J15]|uniref:tetratricopeptide repeat protein n=1 Tax=Photobacterium sp. J15 TaxID=265901 RepID=UPI0007E3962B|nr:hypothetical protein [Photobacterium sp. J15]
MDKKYRVLFPVIAALAGCTSTGAGNSDLDSKEGLLLSSNEKAQLVQFYKDNLKNNENYKLKLVQVYLDMKDIKSAELYSSTFESEDYEKPEYLYTMARLNYLKRNYVKSKEILKTFLDEGGDESQYYLLTGKVLAEQGAYDKAIESFEKSRQLGMPDSDIKNNIAVVKMMKSEFSEAVKILYELYSQNPSDSRLRSNLILAAVKSGRQDIALNALKDIYSEDQARLQLKKLSESLATESRNVQMPKLVKESTKKSTQKPKTTVLNNNIKEVVKSPPVNKVIKLSNKNKAKQINKQLAVKEIFDPKRLKPNSEHVYRIQVLATYNVITPEYLKFLKTNYGPVYSYTHDLWNRYCVGEFNNLSKAKAFMAEMNIKGAFVVDYTKKRYVRL